MNTRNVARNRAVSRAMLALSTAGICAFSAAGLAADPPAKESTAPIALGPIKVLSKRGSTRATFYPQSNKIVTLNGKTHIAWLDTVSETMIATYDHKSKQWSAPVRVGTGQDNHGGPALTCESSGILHVVYGPHHGPFHHRRSVRPNDSSAWETLPDFGARATYPSVVCDDQDTLHIIYRGNPVHEAPRMLYQRRPKDGTWSPPRVLAASPLKQGYTHYHCEIGISRENVLHVTYDIYYNNTAKVAGHMMSADRGETWTLADGRRLDLPVTPDADAFIAREAETLRTWTVVCDSKANPWISLTTPRGIELHHHDGTAWRVIRPTERLTPKLPGDQFIGGYNAMSIDERDRIYIHTSRRGAVVLLFSADGGESFTLLPVLGPDERADMPHRGQNIERPTGHHRVSVPWLLFCTGPKGPDNFGKGLNNITRGVQLSVRP